jgi:hypothetical protein
MRADLAAFLKEPQPRFDFVTHDCCRWVDKWSIARSHPSAIVALGLTYDSERSALVTIKRGGGLVALWTEGMALAGVPEADDAREGDIGVIERTTDDGLNETVAIFTGERWANISDRTLHFGPADVLAMWRP